MLNKILYNLHLGLIILAIAFAAFLPTAVVACGIFTHLFHTYLCNGCILTKIARYHEANSKTFYQEVLEKEFRIFTSPSQTAGFTWAIYLLAIAINHGAHY